jgi:hypothetical protein
MARFGAVLVAAAGLCIAATLEAQQPVPASPAAAQQPDTTRPKTPQERMRERLLTLDKRPPPPDTSKAAQAAADSVARAEQDRALGRAQPQRVTAAAASQVPRDSIMLELLKLQGYTATEYQGESVSFDSDSSKLILKGKPLVAQEGQSLAADSLIVYDQRIDKACAYGKPVLNGIGQAAPMQSAEVCYEVGKQVGVAIGGSTMFASGGTNWYVKGNEIYTQGQLAVYGHHAQFTDCNLTIPHYHFAASRVKIVKNDVLVARDVTLSFGDVPVFWLPFMMQSLKEGRRSGLLTPRFSINDVARTSKSYNRRIEDVGLYWAINDNLGAETALDWFSNNYVAYRGSFDYNYPHSFLRGGLTFKQYNPAAGAKVLTIAGQNSWQPSERTSIRVDANYASSSRFVKQNSFDPRELTQSITSSAGLSRRFDWGSLSLQSTRQQRLSDNQVDLTLPSVGLNISPLTLFKAVPGQTRWYSNATINASASGRANSLSVEETPTNPSLRDATSRNGTFSGGFQMGRFSIQQSASYDKRFDHERGPFGDSIPGLAQQTDSHITWSSSLNFQQRLIGTSTLTPRLQVQGEWVRRDSAVNSLQASAPLRLNFGADLHTDVYAFLPGFGPVSRIRHRISPSFGYAYSPAPQVTDIQRRVFNISGASQIRQQNQLTIGLSQTFEAKMKDRATSQPGAQRDTSTVPEDSTSATLDSPRRLPQARKIMLLSINTSGAAYDFVAVPDSLRARLGRDRYGLSTTSITNSLNSDLLRGFQVSLTHDLFRTTTLGTGADATTSRKFEPRLSSVNASFSLSGDSWLFRALGLTGRAVQAKQPDTLRTGNTPQGGTPVNNPNNIGLGLIGRQVPVSGVTGGPAGAWNASLNYTLLRPRPGDSFTARGNQMMQGNFSFKPTQSWNVHWTTSYSFTDKAFSDHVLTLTRDLHDWEAHFDFVKAQNGNFSFQFRVNLRADPDIKFDYSQHDRNNSSF